jgi:EAL domain-containing protein (putative c-di-GMP-specific phosphodiesterase class I)
VNVDLAASAVAKEEGRVLVVDDEVPLCELFATVLSEAGWQVDVARSGDEALDLLGGQQYDVVLSDIDMPGMNGLQLLHAVRRRDLDLPVLLVTGHPKVESAVQALEQGALRYLLKPLALDTLTQAVAGAARLHRVARLKRQMLAHLGSDDRLLADHAGLEACFQSGLRTLRLVYQPIVHASGGAVFGYESLVRTSEPRLPHPGVLFDVAERLDRVHELGRVIRDSAAAALDGGDIPVAFVNVHPLELSDDALLRPDAPLSRHASSVVLEITERQSIDGVPDLPARIKALRKLGYRLAIDDLGAGYAGLSTFAILEPDVVKLDMALVRGCDHELVKQPLIRSMTTLCKELGALVVAEGIETPAERDAVVSLGCDLLQGFLLGRPAEAADIPRLAGGSREGAAPERHGMRNA